MLDNEPVTEENFKTRSLELMRAVTNIRAVPEVLINPAYIEWIKEERRLLLSYQYSKRYGDNVVPLR